MKKSNGWRGRSNRGKKDYYCHDDRVERNEGRNIKRDNGSHIMGPIKHRVSFKSLKSKRRDMPFKADQPGPRIRHPIRESNSYQITIPYGHKYEKDYIINTLLSYMAPEEFVPILYKITPTEANFYVDDHKTANALLNCDRKITMSDGFKLRVKVIPGFPFFRINDDLKERLKQAVAKRCIPETNALDLSKFHLDPDLCSDYFYALFHPTMLRTVSDIMAEYIPNLKALSLDNNKLQNLEQLSMLSKKFPDLKILHIGNNEVKDIHELDVFKDLKLDELKLTGNSVCNKYKSRQDEYINDVRKRIPRLLRLDGVELPRPIVFDVADEPAKELPSQRIFVTDLKAQEIANQFFQQYFTMFDSDNRQPLLDAYDEHACFSLTTTTFHNNKLNGYLLENRNLFRINNTNRRRKLLKQGRLPVVSYLSEMPKTKHLLDTFTMDITLATQAMMFITITGFFQELDKKDEPIRYFNRTFVMVPQVEGCCIRNEQLHISQPSEAQLKHLHEQLNQLNNQETQNTPALKAAEVTKPMAAELSEELKQQMIETLSQQTNMNLKWSLKCLHETHWIYENALAAFQKFFKLGHVPSEAFIHPK